VRTRGHGKAVSEREVWLTVTNVEADEIGRCVWNREIEDGHSHKCQDMHDPERIGHYDLVSLVETTDLVERGLRR